MTFTMSLLLKFCREQTGSPLVKTAIQLGVEPCYLIALEQNKEVVPPVILRNWILLVGISHSESTQMLDQLSQSPAFEEVKLRQLFRCADQLEKLSNNIDRVYLINSGLLQTDRQKRAQVDWEYASTKFILQAKQRRLFRLQRSVFKTCSSHLGLRHQIICNSP